MTRFVFITGGVVSSLGKGLASAAIGALLQARGYSVRLRKLDPYLNVDPGTMSPYQHGEVYVTDDGAETDLDLGHYERFTGVPARGSDSVTAGRIYSRVLARERHGDYLGGTVQVVPHVTDMIKEFILADVDDADFVLCEIGGTVGDIEGLPFLEAIRQLGFELGRDRVAYVHLTLVPYLASAGELKTKPTQHSVRELRGIGIQPDLLLCRAERPIPPEARRKIALQCNVQPGGVIPALDVASIYEVPIRYHEEGLDTQLLRHFGLPHEREPDLAPLAGDRRAACAGPRARSRSPWSASTWACRTPTNRSTRRSTHGGIDNRVRVNTRWLDAEIFESERRRAAPAGRQRHPGAGRLRRARRRRQGRRGDLRARAPHPLFRHLLRHADRGRRGGAQPGRHRGRELDRVRPDRGAGGRPADRMGAGGRVETRGAGGDLGGTMRLGAYPCILEPRQPRAQDLRRRSRSASATATATRSTSTTSTA